MNTGYHCGTETSTSSVFTRVYYLRNMGVTVLLKEKLSSPL